MKSFHLAALLIVAWTLNAGADGSADYASLLKKYVTPDGVRYSAWKKNAEDLAALQRVTEGMAAAKGDDLAFYLNAYNAWILREALAKYPAKSVKDPLFSFFLGNRIVVTGRKMSFNTFEKEVIRGRFKEPRVHFALNCASRSCPPLNAEPFKAASLEAQLEALAKAFIDSERGVRVKGDEVALSKIFDWYKEDFGGPEAVLKFINRRREQPLSSKAKISYQEYNWNLNETK